MARIINDQLDFFFTIGVDLSPKEAREQMERSWFDLGKKKRTTAIEHRYGDIFVNIKSDEGYGVASIFDNDILIFITSQYVEALNQGLKVGRRFKFTAYEYFSFIGRKSISGRDYIQLWNSLQRLHHTFVETNLRMDANSSRHHSFNYLSEISQDIQDGRHRYFSVILPEFIYENITADKSVLTLHEDYFSLSGGVERFLYLYARKSAGHQANGWTESYRSLYEKSGVRSSFGEFTRMVNRVVIKNNMKLLNYDLQITTGGVAKARRGLKKHKRGDMSLTFIENKG